MNADTEKNLSRALNALTERIVGCAYEVSNVLGAGFLESVYEASLAVEMELAGLTVERQKSLDVYYKDSRVGHYVADIWVEKKLLVEVKALSKLATEHEAQLINYLRATSTTVGLLLNFGKPKLEIKRLVLGFLE
jgi:GxxExxY protein